MGNYKELIVWQKSVDLVTEIYTVTTAFPKEELYGLTSQIRRSSISIPSNIAEGHSRRSTSDYLQFLKIARGSSAELETN
ncbi:four helix bundle protein [Chryseobacterium sp.]|jgi:four helix bundle protein|uniref:four helix bundle protein n=1 Tax=unclassified Chryseobacterium TaxID=2593645 RepID=UPI0029372EE3|nr:MULTISPECIES: four helix bundle protein [unclassified Chryseobacterium]